MNKKDLLAHLTGMSQGRAGFRDDLFSVVQQCDFLHRGITFNLMWAACL